MHTQNKLIFYSQLFLVPKPGNCWMPVIDLSFLNKFLAIPKFKMETCRINMRLPRERRVNHLYRSHGCLSACTYPYPVSKIPQVPPQRHHLPVYQPPFQPNYGPTGWTHQSPGIRRWIQHGEWWLDPQNVLQGEFFYPREHEKIIFTDVSNGGWGAHSNQKSTGGL